MRNINSKSKGAEAQARYRDSLRRRTVDGALPTPETRAVTQAIAASVRNLAGNLMRTRSPLSPAGQALQSVLQSAHRRLVDSGYDAEEAHRRLLLYVRGPDRSWSES